MPLPNSEDTFPLTGALNEAATPGSGSPSADNNAQSHALRDEVEPALEAIETEIGFGTTPAPGSILGHLSADEAALQNLQSQISALTGYTVLVAGLTAASPSFTGNTTQPRSTLKAVAPEGTTGTVLVTQSSLSYTLTIDGPSVAVALASGISTTFAGTISGGGNVAVVGA